MRKLLFALIALAFACQLQAQVKVTTSWTFDALPKDVQVGDEVELIFNVSVIKDWYIYAVEQKESVMAVPASALFEENDSFELVGDFYAVDPKSKYDDIWGDTVSYFGRSGQFRQTIKVLSKNLNIAGELEFQTCSDVTGLCILGTEDFDFKMITVRGESPDENPVDTPADKSGDKVAGNYDQLLEADQGESLWGFFFAAFLFGLAALLTPCVFPMIPMTVAFFTNNSQSKSQAKFKALFYGVSIILIYILIGLLFTSLFGVGIANDLATGAVANIIFFTVFVIFAISFFGYFEINLPTGFVNKMDRKADKGGLLGVFFMAFTLVLVSFSCTGPIVGTVLIQSFQGEVIKPVVGMLGFSSAFAIPFTLFAFFPGMMKELPKSGGWLNTVKVVLGFIELGLGFKFLSVADQAYHWGILDREIFIAIWFVLAFLLGLYLFGIIRFPHDSKQRSKHPLRMALAVGAIAFSVYLFPGFSGGELKALAGYLPPVKQTDFSFQVALGMKEPPERSAVAPDDFDGIVKHADFLELPHDLKGFFDYEQALEYAKEVNKPLFIDFTGHGCVNCRKMEQYVWSDPLVLQRLRNDYVIVALYVDDKTELPESEWYTSPFDNKVKKTVGKQNFDLQIRKFNGNAQPYYVLLDNEEQPLIQPKAYDPSIDNFVMFLDKAKAEFEKR
ncbi:thiol:disulfide interchange protein DsbD [Roseivirga pacifica]|uniref:Thiol:disulfide interchange protein DsbD n=1 Tax=Roseivirga pacifica TaxID=1267423 RepID=A0A1I0MJE3_9BACT|nr:thioredoxin family protein [Roseivirga pacifica]RKQ50418.1 thiol:disulfide interchange protein DsbD [Roseivirga pacifica]SEV87950.1 thiol:disulfide interchange protein DsbD [Roseivirga pacifica]